MNDVDCGHHRNILPTSLYVSIRAVIRLVNGLDSNIVFGVGVAITNMNTTTYINIVDLSLQTTNHTFFSPCRHQHNNFSSMT